MRKNSNLNKIIILLMLHFVLSIANANSLNDIRFASLASNQVLITLQFSQTIREPLTFTIDSPPRIAFDFPGVTNGLKQRSQAIDLGAARSLTSIEVDNKTRVVINLNHMAPYNTKVEGNKLLITIGNEVAIGTQPKISPRKTTGREITKIDFRRGLEGEGRIIYDLSTSDIPVQIKEQGKKIVLVFDKANLPPALNRRLDVVDFGTPVKIIDTKSSGTNVTSTIEVNNQYEYIAYQSGNAFVVEVSKVKDEEDANIAKKRYTGERLSLNFQNIDVRSVLQLLADFTGLNIVVSDSVSGNITLRLKDVPWDQALDIILKTKGLDMRENGNIILVAPVQEISTQEKLEIEALEQSKQLEPVHNELLQINFAKAKDIEGILKGDAGMLSARGKITVDERTNKLILVDTDSNIQEIKALIAELDIPVRQVLVESRIVSAEDTFSRELGVQWGVSAFQDGSSTDIVTSGSLDATDSMVASLAQNTGTVEIPALGDRLNVVAPAAGTGTLALAILGADYLVDLELAASQAEGLTEIISTPRVVTADGQEAYIKDGVQVPYQTVSDAGTKTEFKDATLSINVTPQITPDDRVFMDLVISNSSVGQETDAGPAIRTQELSTSVLVNNGDTVVLGGVFQESESSSQTKVPLLGDIPVVGNLFRNNTRSNNKSELLIFVTPRILNDNLRGGF